MLLLLLHYGDVDVVADSNIITINGGANEVQIHKTRQNGILMNIGWLMDSDGRLISKLHWFWIHCQAGWVSQSVSHTGSGQQKSMSLMEQKQKTKSFDRSPAIQFAKWTKFLGAPSFTSWDSDSTLTNPGAYTWEELWLLLHIDHAVLVMCDKATNLKLKFLGKLKMQTSFSN